MNIEELELILQCYRVETIDKIERDYLPSYNNGKLVAFTMILELLKEGRKENKYDECVQGIYCPFCKEKVSAWRWNKDSTFGFKCKTCDKIFTEKNVIDALRKEKE